MLCCASFKRLRKDLIRHVQLGDPACRRGCRVCNLSLGAGSNYKDFYTKKHCGKTNAKSGFSALIFIIIHQSVLSFTSIAKD